MRGQAAGLQRPPEPRGPAQPCGSSRPLRTFQILLPSSPSEMTGRGMERDKRSSQGHGRMLGLETIPASGQHKPPLCAGVTSLNGSPQAQPGSELRVPGLGPGWQWQSLRS